MFFATFTLFEVRVTTYSCSMHPWCIPESQKKKKKTIKSVQFAPVYIKEQKMFVSTRNYFEKTDLLISEIYILPLK